MIFHFANEVMAHHSKRGGYENIKTETNLLNRHEATRGEISCQKFLYLTNIYLSSSNLVSDLMRNQEIKAKGSDMLKL